MYIAFIDRGATDIGWGARVVSLEIRVCILPLKSCWGWVGLMVVEYLLVLGRGWAFISQCHFTNQNTPFPRLRLSQVLHGFPLSHSGIKANVLLMCLL